MDNSITIQAIKAARRLDALPAGKAYNVIVVKTSQDEWKLIVVSEGKIETIR